MPYIRDDTMVVPLTGINAGAMLFLPANVQQGVVPPQYNFADVPFIPVRPNLQREGIVSKQVTPPKAQPVNMNAFFKGGGLDGQA